MKHILLRTIMAIAFVAGCSCASFAQAAIENIAKQIESKEGSNVTYTERRDPSTKKVIKSTRLMQFKDETLAKSLQAAFEKERANTVTSTYTKDYYFYKFQDGSSYFFEHRKSSGNYQLIIKFGTDKSSSSNVYGPNFSGSLPNFDYELYMPSFCADMEALSITFSNNEILNSANQTLSQASEAMRIAKEAVH